MKAAITVLDTDKQRLEAIFENTLDAILLMDDQGQFIRCNPGATEVLGYSTEEILAKNIWALASSPDIDLAREWLDFLRMGKREGIRDLLKKDGTICQVEYKAVSNILPGVHLAVLRDITERRKAVEALRISDQRFREFMRYLPGAAFIKDESGFYIYDNYCATEVLGLPSDARLGKRDENFLPAEVAEELRKNDCIVLNTGKPHTAIETVKNSNGTTHWLSTKFPIVLEGSEKFVGGISIDVTELEKAQEEVRRHSREQREVADFGLRALILNDELSLMKDATRVICRTLNIDYCTVLELSDDKKYFLVRALNGTSTKTLSEGEIPVSQSTWAGYALERRLPVIVSNLERETRFSGMPLLFQLGIVSGMTVIIHGLGEPLGIVGAFSTRRQKFTGDEIRFLQSIANTLAAAMDRTRNQKKIKEKHMQMQLLSRRLIETQEAERSNLARELHDEVGQVLSAVRFYLESIAKHQDPDRLHRKLEETMETIDHALEQVHSLSLDLRPPMLDDHGLISTLRWYLSGQQQRCAFSIHFEAPQMHDRQRFPKLIETTFFRIVQEVLTNVLRHGNAGNVFIELDHSESGFLRLQIQDDGIGFDLNEAKGSTRLGILGIRERVRLVNGTLDLRSKPGEGTQLIVTIPLHDMTTFEPE